MNRKNSKKRIISLIMVLCIVVGVFSSSPISAIAEETYNISGNTISNEYLKFAVNGDCYAFWTTGGNPSITTDDNVKLLYGSIDRGTSRTIVRINSSDYTYSPSNTALNADRSCVYSVQTINGIKIERFCSFVENTETNRKDTLEMKYVFTNTGSSSSTVGARIMLDTMLGDSDDAPFRIYENNTLVDLVSEKEYRGNAIPQRWYVFDSLSSPSVLASGTFYNNTNEKPDKVQFIKYGNSSNSNFENTISNSNFDDSTVNIYYDPISLNAGEKRTVATYYGISEFSPAINDEPAKISLTNAIKPQSLAAKDDEKEYESNPFQFSAWISNTGGTSSSSVTAKLILPEELAIDNQNSQLTLNNIEPNSYKSVGWMIRALPQSVEKDVNYSVVISTIGQNDITYTFSIHLQALNLIHTHTPSEWIIDNPATCSANGSKHRVCTECQETIQTAIIPALDHHFVHTKTVNATCTADGYVLFTCDRDGCTATRKNVLSALGHTYGGDNICDRCGYTLPSAHEHSYSSSTVAPTCTTSGYTLYECSCGSSYKSDYIEPKGHRWDEGVDTVTKTCTSDGLKTYTCSVCHITKTEVIPAGHTWSETVITEPTCTTDGSKKRTCSFCNEVEYVNIPAGHVWDEGTIITEATCTQTGTKRCECQECHTTEVLEIPALGHRYINGVCQICNHKFIDDVSSNPEHPVYGMFFEVDDIQSAYGSDLINEYGVLLDFNPDAKLNKVAVYLTQDGTMWRRCIACTGTGIKYATYVPYLSYGTDIKYTGLNSSGINTFSLSEGSDHIWRYSDYATIGVNLEDYKGNLLLSLYDIGQAGAETRLFDDLDEMIAWLKTSEPNAKYTDMSVESDKDSILTDSEITFEVKISDAESITAAAINLKFNLDMFEYVDAEWVIGEAMLQDIDPNTHKAVSNWIGDGIDIGTSTEEVLYRFTLKAKETTGASDVGCIVQLESATGKKEYSAIKTIEIIECSHENGYCSELDGNNHTFVCPDCGFTATMVHTYDDNCDSECNDCGYIRTAPHNFETAWSSDGTMHWHECLDCHTHTAEETHTYTDACDSTCNICGYTRVAPHNFKTYWSNDSTEHWHECSRCGLHTDTELHIYSNNCDETCNECGYIRVAPHSYENVWSSDSDGHWHQCSECDSIADFSAHHYNEHGVCAECQYYVPGHFVEPWGNQPTSADVEYLLYHIYFGNEQYPIYQETDYNNDGVTDISDAKYLLYYIFFPEDYPISK